MEEEIAKIADKLKQHQSSGERGLLTDMFIFLAIVALALGAIYLSGNWEPFMKFIRPYINMLFDSYLQVKSAIFALQGNG